MLHPSAVKLVTVPSGRLSLRVTNALRESRAVQYAMALINRGGLQYPSHR